MGRTILHCGLNNFYASVECLYIDYTSTIKTLSVVCKIKLKIESINVLVANRDRIGAMNIMNAPVMDGNSLSA